MTDFDGIVPAIAEALRKRGYETLTPVQQAMLDPELEGRDALVSPNRLRQDRRPSGLHSRRRCLPAKAASAVPGRRWRSHRPDARARHAVKRELEWLYEFTGATIASCVGGMDIRNERRPSNAAPTSSSARRAACGDHLTRGALDLSALRAVVSTRRTRCWIAASARISNSSSKPAGRPPDADVLGDRAALDRRSRRSYSAMPAASPRPPSRSSMSTSNIARSPSFPRPRNAIINVLRYYEARNTIVFCSTRAAVNHLTARLHNRGFSVVALSGELSQNERTHALQAMRDGRARVCIATMLPPAASTCRASNSSSTPTCRPFRNAAPSLRPHRPRRQQGHLRADRSVNRAARPSALLQGAGSRGLGEPPSADEVLARDGERILADQAFAEAVAEDEQPTIADLLATHGAEKVAAAFLRIIVPAVRLPKISFRQSRSEQAAPRADYANRRAPPRSRAAISARASGSRSRSAAGRTPSRAGDPDALPQWQDHKNEIGAIKMQPEEPSSRSRKTASTPSCRRSDGRRAGCAGLPSRSFPARRISPPRRRREPRGATRAGGIRAAWRKATLRPEDEETGRRRAVTTSRQWMPRSGRMLRHGRSAKTTAATVPQKPYARRRDPNGLTGPPMIAGANGRRATAKPLPARGIFRQEGLRRKAERQVRGAGNGAPKQGKREADGSRLSARISSSGSARTARGCIYRALA